MLVDDFTEYNAFKYYIRYTSNQLKVVCLGQCDLLRDYRRKQKAVDIRISLPYCSQLTMTV